jgi:sec-independent protein translocase protein TatB
MFDLAWSEIALVAVVAIVVIGPKDLPDAIRKVAQGVKKLRAMAAEFQSHADELVKEAKLDDVRQQIQEIRNFDLKGTIERAVDNDGEIRRTFNDNPLQDSWKPTPEGGPVAGETAPAADTVAAPPVAPPVDAPAFIPPTVAAFAADAARHEMGPATPTPAETAPPPPEPVRPAMIPPQIDSATAPEKPAAPPATSNV